MDVADTSEEAGEVPATLPLPALDAAPPAVESKLHSGSVLGRYVLLSRLGAGGAGFVYAAFDPKLDRKVAVKVLRTPTGEAHGSEQAQARLLREAQAMARLSHPNVVPIYDVGSSDHGVFMAMELVPGGTLREWLRGGRTRKAILEMLLDAARGLAAAHDAELVHRDFKPDNVLVSRAGRAQVTDFGLVRSTHWTESEAQRREDMARNQAQGAVDTPLTMPDAFVGTPGYMAPEQYAGGPVDARTDQFSFSVTLCEALCGRPPFDRRDASIWERAVSVDRARELLRAAGIPLWIRRVVERGLGHDPEDRFTSMQELIRALEKDPAIVRRRVAAAVAVALSGVVAVGLVRREMDRHDQLCRGAERKLAGRWDGTVRSHVEQAFRATGLARAAPRFASVAAALDAYTHEWVGMHTEACEATRLRAEQPESVMALRIACLDRALRDVGAIVDVLKTADKDTVDKSVQAVARLPPVRECADVSALTARVRPPADPALKQKVDAAGERVARAKALEWAGKYKDGLAVATEATAAAEPLGYGPVLAEALQLRGQLLVRTGACSPAAPVLRSAFDRALAVRDDAVAGRAAIAMALGEHCLKHYPEAHHWTDHARAVLERLEGSEQLQRQVDETEAALYVEDGEGAKAIPIAERALETAKRGYGTESIEAAHVLGLLATANDLVEDLEAARRGFEGALAIYERLLPGHPYSVVLLVNLSENAASQGLGVEAERYARRALAAAEAAVGPDHRYTGAGYWTLGVAYRKQGRTAEALEAVERALAICEKAVGRSHNYTLRVLVTLGQLRADAGSWADAVSILEEAARLSASQPDGYFEANAKLRLAEVLWAAGREPARARELATVAKNQWLAMGRAKAANEAEAALRAHL